MTRKKPKCSPNDRNLDRQKGGGYQYEWELGLEIALLSLLPDFAADWNCPKTEVPIPLHLRQWLEDIESISFDAAGSAGKRLEDVNLHGRNGHSLYIQIKSATSISLPDLSEIVLKFSQTDADHKGALPRFLLIAQGVSYGAHRHPDTLLSWFQQSANKTIIKAFQALKSSLGKSCEALLSRIWIVRGPLHERLINANLHLISRRRQFDCSDESSREKTFRHRNAIAETFKQCSTLKVQSMSREDLIEIVETPPGFQRLLSAKKLDPSVLDGRADLELLEQLLGWDLEPVVNPYLCELVQALQPAVKKEKPLVVNFRECLTNPSFLLDGHANSPAAELNCLALCRLAAFLSGALVSTTSADAAGENDPIALAICWFAISPPKFSRHHSGLTLELHQAPGGYRFVERICEQALGHIELHLDKSTISTLQVSFNLPTATPDWLPNPPEQEEDRKKPQGDKSEDSPERKLSEQIKKYRTIAETSREEAAIAEPELRKLFETCKEAEYQALLIDASEALAKTLKILNRVDEQREVLLEVAESKVYEFGQDTFFRMHEDEFRGLSQDSGIHWYRLQCLKIQIELRAGRFRTANRLLTEIDPGALSPLSSETDRLVVRARLAELRASLVHQGAHDAQNGCFRLLLRLPEQWNKERAQTLLIMCHAAYWTESRELMLTACSAVQKELERDVALDSNEESEALHVCRSGLLWLLATTGKEFNEVLQEWNSLTQTISNKRVWAQLQFLRTNLEFRRRLVSSATECSRRAAVDVLREAGPTERALGNARSAIAAGIWTSALGSVLTSIDLALAHSDWETMRAARQYLSRLFLADGRHGDALRCYAAYGAPFSDKTVESELLEKVDEKILEDALPDLLTCESHQALQRVWKFLSDRAELIGKRGRPELLRRARTTLSEKCLFDEDYFARVKQLKLLAELLRCPVDQEESLSILKIFLEQLESERTRIFDDEIPDLMRRGFWSATGLSPKGQAAQIILSRLANLAPKLTSGRTAICDIVLSIGANSKDSAVQQRALKFLEEQGATEAIAEWKARKRKPTKKEIQDAFDRALKFANERITRTEQGVWHHIGAKSLAEVNPFVKHMTVKQLDALLEALISALKDPDTGSIRKHEVIEVFRQPELGRCRRKLLDEARRLLFAALLGGTEKNIFDQHRIDVNRTVFSGLKFDVGADLRLHKTVCEALGVFHSTATEPEQLSYFLALLSQTQSGEPEKCRNVASSLQCYFQLSGSSDHPELMALQVKLLAHTDDGVKKEALKALGDRVYQSRDLDDLTCALVDGLISPSYQRLTIRKGLAVFSRRAIELPTEHRHYRWAEELNQRLSRDSNPLVGRLADVGFWTQ